MADQIPNQFRFKTSLLLKAEEPIRAPQGGLMARIGGVVSTEASDFEGDRLDQEGVDWRYFEEHGVFNYNHRPGTIIGEPTKVIRKGDVTLVEGNLYLTNPLGRQIYDQARAVEAAGGRWRYGFSVEGSVLERCSKDPRWIRKARVMQISICEHPVNPETNMSLLKAMANVGYREAAALDSGYSPLVKESLGRRLSFQQIKDAIKRSFPNIKEDECNKAAQMLYQQGPMSGR